MRKRFQNKMAESRWSLPATFFLAAVVWGTAGLRDAQVWPCLSLVFIATMLVADLNNTNSLIRVYSRMVSCSFIVLLTIAPMFFSSLQLAVVTLCMVGFFTAIFRCYQNAHMPAWVFYGFLCLGLASLVWVQILYFVPLFWILMATPLFCMAGRTLTASLLGLALPYWFALGYCALTSSVDFFVNHFVPITQFGAIADFSGLTVMEMFLLGVVVCCGILGTVHFITNIYADKIRTRALYRFFIIVDIAALTFLILQPQHFVPLWGVMVVSTAPLTGHYIALTRGRWSAYTTYSLMAVAAALTLYNLWQFLPNY